SAERRKRQGWGDANAVRRERILATCAQEVVRVVTHFTRYTRVQLHIARADARTFTEATIGQPRHRLSVGQERYGGQSKSHRKRESEFHGVRAGAEKNRERKDGEDGASQ